jgi:hypothetical protein
VSNGTWTGSPTSFAYNWERCDAGSSNCLTIDGATSATYTLTNDDVQHTLLAVVAATNPSGRTWVASLTTTGVVFAQVAPVPRTRGAIPDQGDLATFNPYGGSSSSVGLLVPGYRVPGPYYAQTFVAGMSGALTDVALVLGSYQCNPPNERTSCSETPPRLGRIEVDVMGTSAQGTPRSQGVRATAMIGPGILDSTSMPGGRAMRDGLGQFVTVVVVTFVRPATVVAGRTYAIAVRGRTANPGHAGSVTFRAPGNDPYKRGFVFGTVSDSSAWTRENAYFDLLFQTFVRPRSASR